MSILAVRAVGGYARVRTQFKTAIGRFEGIQEPLARIGGHLYMMDAARRMTAGAIDLGELFSLHAQLAYTMGIKTPNRAKETLPFQTQGTAYGDQPSNHFQLLAQIVCRKGGGHRAIGQHA